MKFPRLVFSKRPATAPDGETPSLSAPSAEPDVVEQPAVSVTATPQADQEPSDADDSLSDEARRMLEAIERVMQPAEQASGDADVPARL